MKVKLTHKEFLYLLNSGLLDSQHNKSYISLNLDADSMESIRDWALEKQQKVGFDINYNLTDEGSLLETIADKFLEG